MPKLYLYEAINCSCIVVRTKKVKEWDIMAYIPYCAFTVIARLLLPCFYTNINHLVIFSVSLDACQNKCKISRMLK